MTDTMTPDQRHRCMSHIRGKDTKPEIVVRQWLWNHGFRYRLHVPTLPGSPDIVMRKHKIVIFVNGCFWHGHNCPHGRGLTISDSECCKIPKSNREFWVEKIRRNMLRDAEVNEELTAAGWSVITVWECDLRHRHRQSTLNNLLARINALIKHQGGYVQPVETYDIAAEPDAMYGSVPCRNVGVKE